MNGVYQVFLIHSGTYSSQNQASAVHIWGRSPQLGAVELIFDNSRPVFFVEDEAEIPTGLPIDEVKNVNLKDLKDQKVKALYFNNTDALLKTKNILKESNIRTFESDIRHDERFMMERFLNGYVEVAGAAQTIGNKTIFKNPNIRPAKFNIDLNILSFDIETNGHTGELYSIAFHQSGLQEKELILMVGPKAQDTDEMDIIYVADEKALLVEFIRQFELIDPDVIIGWHVIGFDLMHLEKKARSFGVNFNLGRNRKKIRLEQRDSGGYFAEIPGRVVLDGPAALRSNFFSFERYSLNHVSQKVMGDQKEIDHSKDKVEEIDRMFQEDKVSLAKYNIKDCVLVTDIFNKLGLMNLYKERVRCSGLLMGKVGISTRAFDHLYLPKLHRQGYVAPDIADINVTEHSTGGHVIDPIPGVHEDVLILDFKSLYPSIMRTFKIDPLALAVGDKDIKTPSGHYFSSDENLLAKTLERLLNEREKAKESRNGELSQAIKILMNSFYGVLGSGGCRFYHADLPSSITLTGQYILKESAAYIEELGQKVLYGDTDSLFVQLSKIDALHYDQKGAQIADKLNEYWQKRLLKEFNVTSHLEMEFESYFRKLVLPYARNTEGGAKKRYAGLLHKGNNEEELYFKGLEIVRSDWTDLAKKFQYDLYYKIFYDENIDEFVKAFIEDVKNGAFNNELIYRKRLRKKASEYLKNVPPHVKAAKMLDHEVKEVEYVYTVRGPVPIQLSHQDIDYNHYIEKQLKPIADSILPFFDREFDQMVGGNQMSLFDF